VDVEYYGDDGVLTAGKVRADRLRQSGTTIGWRCSSSPWFLATTSVGRTWWCFVNGLPLAVIELKAPGGETATLTGAFNQLADLQAAGPGAVSQQCLLVTSDGLSARVGSLSADQERFMPWRTTDGAVSSPRARPSWALWSRAYSIRTLSGAAAPFHGVQ
jgi:type I restriction enzyme, R subunit